VELNRAGPDVFVDLVGQVFADARDVPQGAVESDRLDVIGQTFDV
jgi:hypothetical protein